VRKSSEPNAHFQSADTNVHPNDSLLINLKGTPQFHHTRKRACLSWRF